jgi:hypothetical protein
MDRVAECHCGALKAIARGEPELVYVRHCKACQRRTGAVVHSGSRWRKGRVRTVGEHKVHAPLADSGFEIRFHFCPGCASNVDWECDRAPEYHGITVGSFADPSFPAPTFSVWEEAMHPWLGLPEGTDHFAQGLPPTPPAGG